MSDEIQKIRCPVCGWDYLIQPPRPMWHYVIMIRTCRLNGRFTRDKNMQCVIRSCSMFSKCASVTFNYFSSDSKGFKCMTPLFNFWFRQVTKVACKETHPSDTIQRCAQHLQQLELLEKASGSRLECSLMMHAWFFPCHAHFLTQHTCHPLL